MLVLLLRGRLGMGCGLFFHSSNRAPPPPNVFPFVRATGTARRRPDVLRKRLAGQGELSELQFALAAHCVDHVLRPGGVLVYATCSLLREECQDVANRLLRERPGVLTLPFRKGEVPGWDGAITPEGWLRIVPGGAYDGGLAGECDGFYVARFRGTSSGAQEEE